MTEATTEAEQLAREYKDLWNEQAYSKIPEVVSESFVLYDETAPGGEVRGPDGLEEWMRQFTSAFPDFHVEILDMLASEEMIMAEATYTMTHEREFNGIQPTEREVELRAMAKFVVEDGKITEHREYHDRQEILEQLGVTEE